MEIGVITFHSAHNFGATLQTWALQKVLRKRSHNVKIINYHPEVIDELYDPIKEKDPRKVRKIVKKLKRTQSGQNRLLRYERYNRFIKENFELEGDCKTYQELLDARFEFDAYITGSDQVWNEEHTKGYDPAYLLEFVKDNAAKLSYAASIGKNYIPKQYHDKFEHALKSFNAISVREESAKKEIEQLTEKEVSVVLDPTLLLEKEDYDEIKVFPNPGEKYIFVYMMENNEEVIRLANKISKAVGMPIIQRRQKRYFENEIKNCFTCTPGEFLGLVENAEYIITNSFHGTVFSLIYKKRFVSMLHSTTGSRISDLLKATDEESHLLHSENEFKNFEQFEIKDSKKLDERIAEHRQKSLEFLEKGLEKNR